MARKFTYDDFEAAMNESGLGSQFSEGDLKLARENPDAGMSILNYKKDYAAATTDEQRAQANKGAEAIRTSYGEYSGGKDGSGFYATQLSPNSFDYADAPTYSNQYAGQIDGQLNQMLNYGNYSYSGTKPTYNNRYDDKIQELLGNIGNRDPFEWNADTDPLYAQYRKQYTREGQRATANALAEAAAASGGIPSSYASTAAGQAANYYAAQMTDKIPELWKLAYQKWMNDQNLTYSDLAAYQGAEKSDYDKYLDELGQYNTDRSFDYGVWSDAYDRLTNNINTMNSLRSQDLSEYRTQLDQYNTDRAFKYGVLTDEIASQRAEAQDAIDKATLAGSLGDFQWLKDMGINTGNAEYDDMFDRAAKKAQYGDYSGLADLGVDVKNLSGLSDFEKQFAVAEALAKLTGDTTYLRKMAGMIL